MRLTEHPVELRISATTMIPLIPTKRVEYREPNRNGAESRLTSQSEPRPLGSDCRGCQSLPNGRGSDWGLPAQHGSFAVSAVVVAVGLKESRHVFLRRRDQQAIARLGGQSGTRPRRRASDPESAPRPPSASSLSACRRPVTTCPTGRWCTRCHPAGQCTWGRRRPPIRRAAVRPARPRYPPRKDAGKSSPSTPCTSACPPAPVLLGKFSFSSLHSGTAIFQRAVAPGAYEILLSRKTTPDPEGTQVVALIGAPTVREGSRHYRRRWRSKARDSACSSPLLACSSSAKVDVGDSIPARFAPWEHDKGIRRRMA